MFAILSEEVIAGKPFLSVSEIVEEEPSSGSFALCGPSVAVGDVYAGGAFLRREGVSASPAPRGIIEARFEAIQRLEDFVNKLRERVVGTSDASKLAVYQTKYEVALAALSGQQWALSALEPEAKARGESALELATLVRGLGDQWRAAGLAIDAVYQKYKAEILTLGDIARIDDIDISGGWPV